MRRRSFIVALAGVTVALPRMLAAQQKPVRRMGALSGLTKEENQTRFVALTQSLKELGWVIGENLQLETRWAPSNPEQAENFAKELVALHPDVLFAHNTISVAALLRETRTIPIIFASVFDPIQSGFVTSMARPG